MFLCYFCCDDWLTNDRCFPHIVHLIAEAFHDALKYTPDNLPGAEPDLVQSVQSDVVKRMRSLIVACRDGGKRREEFCQLVSEMHQASADIPLLTLIYDVITRWSATYNMIGRFLLLLEVHIMPTILSKI